MHNVFSDRYDNLVTEVDGTATDLHLELIKVLRALAEGTARRPLRDDEAIVDEIMDAIRERIVGWASTT